MAALTYRGTELRSLTAGIGYWFHVVPPRKGTLKVKGTDPPIPAKRGRWAGNRLADIRTVMLHGEVTASSESDYATKMAALDVIFDPELSAGALVLGTDYPGQSVSETLQVRFVNYFVREDVDHLLAELDVQLDTVDSPDWT